jgi:hypothetical protein
MGPRRSRAGAYKSTASLSGAISNDTRQVVGQRDAWRLARSSTKKRVWWAGRRG